MERIHRRLSKEPSASVAVSDSAPASPIECSYASMDLIQHGSLRPDPSSRRGRPEYLVLTDQCLVKFTSIEAARTTFPQIELPSPQLQRSASSASMQSKYGRSEPRLEVPLTSVTAVFNDGLSASRCDLDVWWTSQDGWPISYRTMLAFSTPVDMEDWLAVIHRACRSKVRQNNTSSFVTSNIRDTIHKIVHSTETATDDLNKTAIFPIVKRSTTPMSAAPTTDDCRSPIPLSSYYLAIGPFMCYLVEILQPEPGDFPSELRAKSQTFGTVTLARFRASVATHTQSFIMVFRPPFGRDLRLDLASVHYRRVIDILIKTDRVLKPMWPQHLQSSIFEIRGLPPPLQLTSGNDLGGLGTSLPAYCAAFQVPMPTWWIDWNTPSQPCFCLAPSENEPYSPLQILAVFRALRYNSFFKAISFENVDLRSMAGQQDTMQQGDGVVHVSSGHSRLPEDQYESLLQAPILEQEMHSLLFASDSIRSINLNHVGSINGSNSPSPSGLGGELIRPIVALLRRDLAHCHSLYLAGNQLAQADADELAVTLVLDHVRLRRLDLSNCDLGDAGLAKIWTALAAQGPSLEAIDTSSNWGFVKEDVMRNTLSQFRHLTTLRIAKNTRLESDVSLFDIKAMSLWRLEVLDLSGIVLNDATVDVLAQYLSTDSSVYLRSLHLNRCGLTGSQVGRLCKSMGICREMTMQIEASRLDLGIDELCDALIAGYGPWSLFAQMIDFSREESYVKLLQALTENQTICCLSLAGSSIPDDASDVACRALTTFFLQNTNIQYLDMSGYDSKLDEGRLGRGFSKALSALSQNKSIEHLRVRSQMLNLNIGDLAGALSGNSSLRTLDCEYNDFDLKNYKELIKCMADNKTVRFMSAFAEHEQETAVHKSLEAIAAQAVPTRRPSMMSRFKPDKAPVSTDKTGVRSMRQEWDNATQELSTYLDRNQLDTTQGRNVNSKHDYLDWSYVFASEFGGLALYDFHHCDRQRLAPSNTEEGLAQTEAEVYRSKSTNSSESNGTGSTDGGSNESGVPTPSEMEPKVTNSDFNADENELDVAIYEEFHDAYSSMDSPEADLGLQMKRYQRFGDDRINRIDEEDA